MRALRSEAVKLFTTRLWLWLGVTLVGLTGVLIFLIVNSVEDADEEFYGPDFSVEEMAEMVTFTSAFAYAIAAVLGILGLTGEYRHQTITATLLAVPRRLDVLRAKLVLYGIVGGVCGLLFSFVVAVVALPMLDGKGYDISLSDGVVAGSLSGVVLVSALFGMLGVAIGALLRNQALAITATIIYLFVVENILLIVESIADYYPYLPGAAARAVTFENVELDGDSPIDLLSAGQSAFVLLAWVLGLALIGWLITLRRDVA
jgi:hypothetical protein